MTKSKPSVLEYASKRLAQRDWFIAELRVELLRQGYEEPDIELAVESLIRAGFLDDARKARLWLEKCDKGQDFVRAYFTEKGVADALIVELLGSRDEEKLARAAIRGIESDPARVARRLSSRGFEGSTIESVVEKL